VVAEMLALRLDQPGVRAPQTEVEAVAAQHQVGPALIMQAARAAPAS